MVGEASAHVQGESLKALAALLIEAFQLPDRQGGNEAMHRLLIVTACAAVVGACAGITQQHALDAYAPVKQFCDAAATGPDVATLQGKTFIENVTEINADMLSNPNIPTPAEASALSRLDARRFQCRQEVVSWASAWQPSDVPILQDQFFTQTSALGDLIQRKVTYGEANRRIYEAFLEATRQTNANRQAEIASAQAEEAQKRAILGAYLASGLWKAQPPAPAPVIMPPATNCVSNAVGDSVYTSCH